MSQLEENVLASGVSLVAESFSAETEPVSTAIDEEIDGEPSPGGAVKSMTEQKKRWKIFTMPRRKRAISNVRSGVKKIQESLPRKPISTIQNTTMTLLNDHINPEVENLKRRSANLHSRLSRATEDRFSSGKLLGGRGRSNTGATNTLPRKGKKNRKKKEAEEREKRFLMRQQIDQVVQSLVTSIAMKDKELFLTCFVGNGAEIAYPVGILSEKSPADFFDTFIETFHSVLPAIDIGSVVVDLNSMSLHCEVSVVSQYNGHKDATQFSDPHHWHIDFDLNDISYLRRTPSESRAGTSVEGDFRSDFNLRDIRKGSDASGLSVRELKGKPRFYIRRWHVYSSLSRTEKITGRTLQDTVSGVRAWTGLTRKYGFGFAKAHFFEAFATEKIPKEVDVFCHALTTLQKKDLNEIISPSCRRFIVTGIFELFYDSTFDEDVYAAVHSMLQLVSKRKFKAARCDNAFRCGNTISARLVLNVRRELIPAFLLLRLSVDKAGKTGKVKELLLCSPPM